MKVRFSGHGWACCKCNAPMYFMDPAEVPRRRMTCASRWCKHFGKEVFEPVIKVKVRKHGPES